MLWEHLTDPRQAWERFVCQLFWDVDQYFLWKLLDHGQVKRLACRHDIKRDIVEPCHALGSLEMRHFVLLVSIVSVRVVCVFSKGSGSLVMVHKARGLEWQSSASRQSLALSLPPSSYRGLNLVLSLNLACYKLQRVVQVRGTLMQ